MIKDVLLPRFHAGRRGKLGVLRLWFVKRELLSTEADGTLPPTAQMIPTSYLAAMATDQSEDPILHG